jgi:DNA-binding beta-propeller fold protein YncE
MFHRVSSCLVLALALAAAGCSSGSSAGGAAPPPPAAGIKVSGAVVDGPVAGATISAYAVSAAGVVATTALATATTSATGSYSLTLPAGTTGTVLIASTGGTFIDDATGKTVDAPTLKALIPDVSAGSSVTAQLTPLTTIAAQLALATSSAKNPVGSVSSAINAAIGSALGGQTNILATPLVNVSTAGCAAAASQASVDASLVLAGISQLAAAYHVDTADLIEALVADAESDNVFDGMADGVPLTVPLSGGTVQLCTIEGNCPGAPAIGLAQALGAAVIAFQSSGADTCGATESSTQQQAFTAEPHVAPAMSSAYRYSYTLNATISGFSGASNLQANMLVGLNCQDDGQGNNFHGVTFISASGPFSIVTGANGETTEDGSPVGINAQNDCGTNTWKFTFVEPSDQVCTVTGATSGTFTSSDGGYTNVAASPPSLTCKPLFTIGGKITGLTSGSVVLEDNGGDDLTVAENSSRFTFPTELAGNATYDVTVKTQPSGFNCTVSPTSPQPVGNSNVTSIAVSCSPTSGGGTPGNEAIYVIDSTYTLFEFSTSGEFLASAKLPGQSASVGNLNGGGITVDPNNVYVTLGAPSTGVAAFNRVTLAPVTLPAGAFANLNTPRAIVFDPANAQFYIANGGSTVTVYGATGTYLSGFTQSSSAIYGPSGIAYDAIDNALWIANYTGGGAIPNPTYGVAEFTPGGTLIANFPTADTNPPTPFAPPVNTGHELPYSISYCGNALAVAYIGDSSGSGTSQAAGYGISGSLLGARFAGTITNLHAMACDPAGNVFVAADNGLMEYADATGASIALPAGGFTGLKPPIYGVGVGPASGLNSPEGLVYANNTLYVANAGSNQVLVYAAQTNPSTGEVTGLTLTSTITADINDPVRLALDSGGHLFVANAGDSTITAYDLAAGNAEITAPGSGPLISGGPLNRPLGVAVDSAGNLYVANNGSNTIAIYQPVTSGSVSGGYKPASFSPLSADAEGDAFTAPGALSDVNIAGQDYLLVGIGSTTGANHVYLYAAPFSGLPTLVYDLSSVNDGANCASMPTGPTGFALFLSQTQPLTSQIFVASYYKNEVTEYLASQLIGTSSVCPNPITTGSQSGVSGPEGVAVDAVGRNVFVSNAGANTITVYGAGSGLSAAPIFTLHN